MSIRFLPPSSPWPSPAELARQPRAERERQAARCVYGLYRWYVERSQQQRNWNPDRSFDWRSVRPDHDPRLLKLLEGFYAVEQYAPDYTSELVSLTRQQYGRSQFHMRWGSEEEKHSDLWRNALLFTGYRTARQVEDYTADLRRQAWRAPFSGLLEMLFYTVFQERAAQLIYQRARPYAQGAAIGGGSATPDPSLDRAFHAIIIDEAAHFEFFLSVARIYLHFCPQEALEAMVKVLRNFAMPAAGIVPDYDAFTAVLIEANVHGPALHALNVVRPALKALGLPAVRAIEEGIRRSRDAVTPEGALLTADFADQHRGILHAALLRLYTRINRFERATGLASVDPTFPAHRPSARD